MQRLTDAVTGARVCAVVEPDEERRTQALAHAPDAVGYQRLDDALAAGGVDAVVVATPGSLHADMLRVLLAEGLPVLCEKPLTQDPESSLRVIEAEQATGRRLIQVGFMRRFDPGYLALRQRVEAAQDGDLLLLHAAHRNAGVGPGYQQSMLITDSLVHEFDVLPWLAGARPASIEIRFAKQNPAAPAGLKEPILALLELDNGVLADIEMNVNAPSYQVVTEGVFAGAVMEIGDEADRHDDFTTRFSNAYRSELQAFVDGVAAGQVGGPSSWDGYCAAVTCQAGLQALAQRQESPARTGAAPIDLPPTPEFFR